MVAGVVCAALTAVGCSCGEPAPTVPAVSSTSPATGRPSGVGLDSRPTVVAVAATGDPGDPGDVVFVATAGGPRYPPHVVAVDSASWAIVGRWTAVGQPNGLAIDPRNRLWVASVHHPDMPPSPGITVLDANSLQAVATYNIGADALSVARVGDAMWVGTATAVHVLDPDTGAERATYGLGGPAFQLLSVEPSGAAAPTVAVAEGAAVELLSRTGESLVRRAVPAAGNVRLATGAGLLWMRAPTGDGGAELRLLDAGTLAELGTYAAASSPEGGLAASGSRAWIGDNDAGVLICAHASEDVASTPSPAVTRPMSPDTATGVLGVLPDGSLILSESSGLATAAGAC